MAKSDWRRRCYNADGRQGRRSSTRQRLRCCFEIHHVHSGEVTAVITHRTSLWQLVNLLRETAAYVRNCHSIYTVIVNQRSLFLNPSPPSTEACACWMHHCRSSNFKCSFVNLAALTKWRPTASSRKSVTLQLRYSRTAMPKASPYPSYVNSMAGLSRRLRAASLMQLSTAMRLTFWRSKCKINQSSTLFEILQQAKYLSRWNLIYVSCDEQAAWQHDVLKLAVNKFEAAVLVLFEEERLALACKSCVRLR